MKKTLLTTGALLSGSLLSANILVNADFSNGFTGWEAFGNFVQGAAVINSAWGIADAPVVNNGNGSASFAMNSQLPTADPFWAGAAQNVSFQQNFWTPDNSIAVTPTTDLYGQTLTFTGSVSVTEGYAPGNSSVAFIQFLDTNFNAVVFETADVLNLAGGTFSVEAVVPMSGLNIVQVGFRNSGTVSTAGEITFSNLSVTAVPEPSTYAAILGVIGLGLVWLRKRR